METIVEKQVQLSSRRAQRLEQLAAAQGTTENALIEKALDLLFQEQQEGVNIPAELQADWELLQQWEAELESQPVSRSAIKIDPEEIVSFVGTPIDPINLRRPGD